MMEDLHTTNINVEQLEMDTKPSIGDRAMDRVVILGVWRLMSGHNERAGRRAYLSITPSMNGAY
jgi:hypothetical protein